MLTKLTIASILTGAAMLAFTAGPAAAQYPPPTGACELRLSATSVGTGGSTGITITVRDVNGGTVPGVPVDVKLVDQPGDASLVVDNKTTNAGGQITGTLHAGTEAGSLRVVATTESVECGAALSIGTGAVAPLVVLPNTGTGSSDSGSMFGLAITGLLEIGALGLLLAYVARRMTSRR